MSELPPDRETARGMPAPPGGRAPPPLSTARRLHVATPPELDQDLRARLRYLAWRRLEIRAPDVDDIVRFTLDAYRQAIPRHGIEPERYDLLVDLFRRECGRFLERVESQGRAASDCDRNPVPRERRADAPRGFDDVARRGPSSQIPTEARSRPLWVLLEIRSGAHDVRPGPSSPDGRSRVGDRDSGTPPFVRRRRARGISLRTILTRNGLIP